MQLIERDRRVKDGRTFDWPGTGEQIRSVKSVLPNERNLLETQRMTGEQGSSVEEFRQ
jgi:hypothetical protein